MYVTCRLLAEKGTLFCFAPKEVDRDFRGGVSHARIVPRSDYVIQCIRADAQASPKRVKDMYHRLLPFSPGAAGTAFEILVHFFWNHVIETKLDVNLTLGWMDDAPEQQTSEVRGCDLQKYKPECIEDYDGEEKCVDDILTGYFTPKNFKYPVLNSILRYKHGDETKVLAIQVSIVATRGHGPPPLNALLGKKVEKPKLASWDYKTGGKLYTLAGKFYAGMRGDLGPAYNAELWEPSGLALDKDQKFLYLADYGSHRVRRINLEQMPLNIGIVETVAGNGDKGKSGDGGPAIAAQLDHPSVAVDLNQMLWICDSGNNVLRVVSMEIPVRKPGSNEFARNIILTAAGGAVGQITKGDGGVALLARMQAPWGVAVSSAFISNEDGTLPVNVYITETGGQQVRTMSLEFQSYLGVINTHWAAG
eukprot:s216_g32.t1